MSRHWISRSFMAVSVALAVSACGPAVDNAVAPLNPISVSNGASTSSGGVDPQLAALLFGNFNASLRLAASSTSQNVAMIIDSRVSDNKTYAHLALNSNGTVVDTLMGLVSRGRSTSDPSIYLLVLKSQSVSTIQNWIGSGKNGAIEITLAYRIDSRSGAIQFESGQSQIKVYSCQTGETNCTYPVSGVWFSNICKSSGTGSNCGAP